MFSLEHAQLLTEGNDLQAEAVTGTEEGVEEGEKASEKWNHSPGLIAQGLVPAVTLAASICYLTEFWRRTRIFSHTFSHGIQAFRELARC